MDKRLFDHNNGTYRGSFTAKTNDWEIFFRVDELNEITARNIEAHIKRMKSKSYYINLTKYPEIIQRLIEKYAGSSR